jgi:hypothetical protein
MLSDNMSFFTKTDVTQLLGSAELIYTSENNKSNEWKFKIYEQLKDMRKIRHFNNFYVSVEQTDVPRDL